MFDNFMDWLHDPQSSFNKGSKPKPPRNLWDRFFPDIPTEGTKYHVDPNKEDWIDKLGNLFGVPK